MEVRIEITDLAGVVIEHVRTDSYLLAYDNGDGQVKISGNMMRSFMMQQAGSMIKNFVGNMAAGVKRKQ